MSATNLLDEFRKFIDDFSERQLRGYLTRLKSSRFIPTSPKEINDPLWGTIKIDPLEVILLDSPILQRLRLIRQLGVVHWVYPAAAHSRFEHTLGVLHQSQQLINAINQAAILEQNVEPIIDAKRRGIVRACAILHDIGHTIFSHVSEHAVMKRVDITSALTEFKRKNGIEKIQLSELTAFYIVGSPAFVELLTTALDKLGQPIPGMVGSEGSAEKIIECAQNAIVGRHIDEELPLLHEIISGPFDADKLDYYSRDASNAGIPSLLDISRLIQKISVEKVKSADLPDGIASKLSDTHTQHWLFGLKSSGASILDELHLARVLLYSKIYRHKKVQATEAMVEILFDQISITAAKKPLEVLAVAYGFSDDQILTMDQDAIWSKISTKPSEQARQIAEEILTRLRERNLFVSAFLLREEYCADDDAIANAEGLQEFHDECGNSQKRTALKRKIIEKLQSLPTPIKKRFSPEAFDVLSEMVCISAKKLPDSGTVIDHALVRHGGTFVRGRSLPRFNRSAWADVFKFDQPGVRIFSPREIAPLVYLVTERILHDDFEVILPALRDELSEADQKDIGEVAAELEQLGWYDGVSLSLRPIPKRLKRADVEGRIAKIVAKLAEIDEPIGEQKLDWPDRGSPAHVRHWLSQFRDDSAIDEALVCLEELRVLGRKDSKKALEAFSEAHPKFKGATICPFGDLKDSSAVQGYLTQDLGGIFPNVCTLADAAKRKLEAPVVFFDDLIASGGQASDLLGTWFEDAELQRKELEEQRLPFEKLERDYLLGRPVAFVFVAAWSDGLKTLADAVKKIGLDATIYAHLNDEVMPFAFPDGARKVFEAKAAEVGAALLTSEGKGTEKIESRKLGYGNRGMLLASRLNVPTQTLGCIWMEGTYKGLAWNPLIRRRKKI